MSIDRIVFAFAGLFIWVGLGVWYMTGEQLWLAVDDRLRRCQPVSDCLHRLLPLGDHP